MVKARGLAARRVMPDQALPLSYLPPLVAVALALVTGRATASIGIGAAVGLVQLSVARGLGAPIRLTIEALTDLGHLRIVAFAVGLGGLLALVRETGGTAGLAARLAPGEQSRRGATVSTVLMGFVIFFDDYANSLTLGGVFRPIYDRLRISREKLAFLVDATAAPVASLAPLSTWVAYEVAQIQTQWEALDLEGSGASVFFASIPFRFYPLTMLAFAFAVAFTGRDFGRMRIAEAEARAGRAGHEPEPKDEGEAMPPDLGAAAIPLGALVIFSLLVYGLDGAISLSGAGEAVTLRAVLAAGSASFAVCVGVYAALSLGLLRATRRGLSVQTLRPIVVVGFRDMLVPTAILLLAWLLAGVCQQLGTARALSASLGPWLPAAFVPLAVFGTSALVSFATGTSWGTMGLVFPLAVPLAHSLGAGDESILLASVGAVLSGSVFGDHCSPISDTTVMSSVASGCAHEAHVRTQLPYALWVGLTAVVGGDLGMAFALYPAWVGALVSVGLALAGLVVFGRLPDAPQPRE